MAIKNDIDKSWANIDVLLKQRHDELSKLLDVTKGYMDFERDTLTKITQARSQYSQAVTFDQKAQADQSMTSALRGFFAVAENYPDLKADSNFQLLQKRITDLENADCRPPRVLQRFRQHLQHPHPAGPGHVRGQLHATDPAHVAEDRRGRQGGCGDVVRSREVIVQELSWNRSCRDGRPRPSPGRRPG